ncbi:MAG TPA: hypothetical protein VHD91_02485 [Gaiellaceae bacterium]|nr:hypothetical protein [Gaiellaceae bacterium]
MERIGLNRWGALGLLAALAVTFALAAGVPRAAASPSSLSEATSTCWKDVINDWLAHSPNVVGTYPIACYTQAIQHLDSYADIQGYSNAPQDIRRALLAALRNQGSGPTSGGSNGSNGNDNSSGPTASGHNDPGDGGGTGFITNLFNKVGPGNAQSVPLPLLVLGGLALVLLLGALGTYVAKRVQERRIAPAPARRP